MVTFKKCSTWFASGAPPDTINRTLPPRRALTLENARWSTSGTEVIPSRRNASLILNIVRKITFSQGIALLTCMHHVRSRGGLKGMRRRQRVMHGACAGMHG
jgi:hypothetical protein